MLLLSEVDKFVEFTTNYKTSVLCLFQTFKTVFLLRKSSYHFMFAHSVAYSCRLPGPRQAFGGIMRDVFQFNNSLNHRHTCTYIQHQTPRITLSHLSFSLIFIHHWYGNVHNVVAQINDNAAFINSQTSRRCRLASPRINVFASP